MSFAVVVPSRDISNLVPCVQAIREYDGGHPLIILDDGLKLDPWPECLDAATLIPGVKPFVFPRAINMGLRAAFEAGHDAAVACNDDALLRTRGGFSLLYDAWKQNPQYGLIGAVTNITGQPLQKPQNVGLRHVPHIAFVCVLIPRPTCENIQWMDERYCIDYGCCDRDLCEAVNRAGLKVGVYDFCFVDHGSLRSTFRGAPKRPLSFRKNRRLFERKWKARCR